MNSSIIRLAGLSGAIAVAVGAYGSHVLRERVTDQRRLNAFQVGSRYHFFHTLALFGVAKASYPLLSSVLFVSGMTVFCGTIYWYSICGNEYVRRFTPIGGVTLIVAWLTLVL
uniref:DUF423 domain-containing protein n=1 Tax=Syphacia muris TaxID=451379 RepID=A0A0N5AMY5_9BILA